MTLQISAVIQINLKRRMRTEDLKYNDDEKGQPVKDMLAEKVLYHFIGNLGSEKIAMKQKSYLCPHNCHTLAVSQCT